MMHGSTNIKPTELAWQIPIAYI